MVVACVGCVDQSEKPPPPTCEGRCGGYRQLNVGHVGPGSAGAGGESGTSDEPVRLVVQEVELLVNIPDIRSTGFIEPADIVVEGPNGDATGRWNGSDAFSIDGVAHRAGVWAQATPFGGDAFRTLQPIDTSRPNASGVVGIEQLVVVSASEIDLALGAISSPLTPNPARAQAVLIATKGRVPTSDVSVSAPAAEAVIYVQNGAYTDAETMTDSSGVFILANVPPGDSFIVTLSGEVNSSEELRLVSGGVTFGAVGN